MRKRNLLCGMLVCAMLLVVGCTRVDLSDVEDDSAQEQTVKTRNVQFVVKGLEVDYSGTRATVASEGMTDLWIWEGSTLLKHQVSTDADFGAPTVSLTIGAHDLTFVTSKSDGQTWSDGVWTCTKVQDTYGTVLAYTVSGSSSSKQVQLTRCNGKLRWTIEDAVPANASVVSISVPQCYGLDASLNGVSAGTYNNSLDISGVRGVTGVTVSAMVLPADHANGSTISPSITITDGTDNICSYTNEVTVTPNVVTNIHGSFFTGSGGLTMVLNSEWGEQNDVALQ